MDALHLTKCTSLAVNDDRTSDGHVLVAHNEDWVPEDEPGVYIVHASPDDEPAWLAMTYGALLPNVGFNSAGIAQLCDTVYPADSRIGIPRVIVSRAVLGARTMAEAIRYVLVPQRAAGYNHMLIDKNGEMYSVEVSASKFALLYGQEGYIVHTNHYLDPKMQAIEVEPDELIGTRLRYFRATRLIRRMRKPHQGPCNCDDCGKHMYWKDIDWCITNNGHLLCSSCMLTWVRENRYHKDEREETTSLWRLAATA